MPALTRAGRSTCSAASGAPIEAARASMGNAEAECRRCPGEPDRRGGAGLCRSARPPAAPGAGDPVGGDAAANARPHAAALRPRHRLGTRCRAARQPGREQRRRVAAAERRGRQLSQRARGADRRRTRRGGRDARGASGRSRCPRPRCSVGDPAALLQRRPDIRAAERAARRADRQNRLGRGGALPAAQLHGNHRHRRHHAGQPGQSRRYLRAGRAAAAVEFPRFRPQQGARPPGRSGTRRGRGAISPDRARGAARCRGRALALRRAPRQCRGPRPRQDRRRTAPPR